MTSSNPTDLAKLLECVYVTDGGSAAQDALSNLFGVEIPLDAGVDEVAGFIATKLGLQSKNSLIQTSVFVLTKAAILEAAQLVGIGSGLAKLDLMSFELAQLKKQVEQIDKKLDVILSTPLQLAVDFFGKAMRHMENEDISATIKEMEKVRDHAMQAFLYSAGQGPSSDNLKSAVLVKQLIILSEVLTKSVKNDAIVPFSLLDEKKKRTIASLIEDEVTSMQRFHDSHTISMFTRNKREKIKKRQDIMDQLLKSAYPFISEGRGLTSALVQLEMPYNLRVLPMFVPEGKEDAVSLVLGQIFGGPLTVNIWRDGNKITFDADAYSSILQSVDINGQTEVKFQIGDGLSLSAPQQDFKHNGRTFSNALLLHRLMITGHEEQVVNRRAEINRDLVKRTCAMSGVSEMSWSWLEPETTYVQLQVMTVLHLAAEFKCSAEIVNILIEAGADVHAVNGYQSSPLHFASKYSSVPVVKVLLEAGADVNALNCSQCSPLHYASKRNPAVVPVLLEAGAKVNVLDVVQCSPLYWAALFDHKESVIALMKASADLHLGENPLKDPSVSKKMKTLIKNLFK